MMDKQTELAIHLLAGTAIKLKNGQASAKKELAKWYRPMTVDEIKALTAGTWVMMPSTTLGNCLPCRVTSVMTWKRTAERWELHLVYGLKHFYTLTSNHTNDDHRPLVPLE
jgi:hypothetical protein